MDDIPTVTPPLVNPHLLKQLKDFPVRPDDLFIVSFAKSGTTWLQQIVKLIRNEGKEDGQILSEAIPWLEALDPNVEIRGYWVDVDAMLSPRAFKSHWRYGMMPGGPPHTTPAKYIYAARNPKDVFVSMYYHIRRDKRWQFSGTWETFLSSRDVSRWFDHVLEWWKHKDAPNILFFKYEDMKKDLPKAVGTIAEFMGHSLKPAVVDAIVEQSTFDNMKGNPAANRSWEAHIYNTSETPFLRKGVVGDWKSHFTAEQSTKFDAIYSQRIQGSGLELDFGN